MAKSRWKKVDSNPIEYARYVDPLNWDLLVQIDENYLNVYNQETIGPIYYKSYKTRREALKAAKRYMVRNK